MAGAACGCSNAFELDLKSDPPRLASQLLAVPELEEATKQAAAVNFKNLVKYRWVSLPSDGGSRRGGAAIAGADRSRAAQTAAGHTTQLPATCACCSWRAGAH